MAKPGPRCAGHALPALERATRNARAAARALDERRAALSAERVAAGRPVPGNADPGLAKARSKAVDTARRLKHARDDYDTTSQGIRDLEAEIVRVRGRAWEPSATRTLEERLVWARRTRAESLAAYRVKYGKPARPEDDTATVDVSDPRPVVLPGIPSAADDGGAVPSGATTTPPAPETGVSRPAANGCPYDCVDARWTGRCEHVAGLVATG